MIVPRVSHRAFFIGLTSLLLASCQGSKNPVPEGSRKQQVGSELVALREDVLRVDKLPKPQRLFEERCAICHGDASYHPATRLLAKRYGPGKGAIVGRADLTPDAVKAVVRNGQLEMFPFRKVDLNDEDLNEIANYVAGGTKK